MVVKKNPVIRSDPTDPTPQNSWIAAMENDGGLCATQQNHDHRKFEVPGLSLFIPRFLRLVTTESPGGNVALPRFQRRKSAPSSTHVVWASRHSPTARQPCFTQVRDLFLSIFCVQRIPSCRENSKRPRRILSSWLVRRNWFSVRETTTQQDRLNLPNDQMLTIRRKGTLNVLKFRYKDP